MATPKSKSTKKSTTKKESTKKAELNSDIGILKRHEVDDMAIDEVIKFAKKSGVDYPEDIDMNDRVSIVLPVLSYFAQEEELLLGFGILDILSDGYGFLRNPDTDDNRDDIYVSQSQVRRFNLRKGDKVAGQVRQPKEKERYYGLTKVEMVNGYDPESSQMKERPNFEKLTPIYPNERLTLETGNKPFSSRLIDIFSPIGKGQRALIVAPPKAGKTILLKEIARGITENHPEVELFVALIGERPEEVTDMKRSVDAEVIASTFDEGPERHVQVSDMALAKAQRLVECGKDVVILLDSITRLGRAHNAVIPHSGKILSGGVDSNALRKPKKFFGAARNTEEGGSLTIIATALIDTGSKMDGVIFEEFKGTGNMELVLDRELSDRRIYPAFNIVKSGTRKEELLMSDQHLSRMYILRKMLGEMSTEQAMQFMSDRMRRTKTNQEFLDLMSQ